MHAVGDIRPDKGIRKLPNQRQQTEVAERGLGPEFNSLLGAWRFAWVGRLHHRALVEIAAVTGSELSPCLRGD